MKNDDDEDEGADKFNVEYEVNKEMNRAYMLQDQQNKDRNIENLRSEKYEGDFKHTKRQPKTGNLKRNVCDQI